MLAIFFVLFLPVAAILAVGTSIFICHHYHSIVVSTASSGGRVTWPADSYVDLLWKTPYVVWLLGCSSGPAMLLGGVLTKKFGVSGLIIPLASFWLIFPIVQLSSLYASTIWMPFTPLTLRKMAGKPFAVFGYYLQSGGILLFASIGFWLCFLPNQFGMAGSIPGGFILAISLFVYARLIGQLGFSLSFVGAEERPAESKFPHYTDDTPVSLPKKKKKKKTFVQPSQMPKLKTPDSKDGVGYDVNFADDHVPEEIETEKEFVPPQFAWDDEPVTPYAAKQPEVEEVIPKEKYQFEVKESELKLISRDDLPKEPKWTWTADVWTTFITDPNTVSHFGIAVIWFVIDGGFSVYLRGFLS